MKENSGRKQALAEAGTILKNSCKAVLKGEFLLRLNVGRYSIHILYTFLLIMLTIWISLMIDNTLTKVEKNKEILREMEIECSEKAFDVATLGKRTTIESMLESMGSNVKEPEKPATVIVK